MSTPQCVSLGISLLFLLLAPSAHAVVASSTVHQIKQPDGRTLAAVQRGDERRQWVEKTDGYTIAQGPDRYWYYVQRYDARRPVLSPRRANLQVPSGISQHLHPILELLPPSVPFDAAGLRKGTMATNVLLILVAYNETPATYTAATDWANAISNSQDAGAKSIADYYQQASYGAVSLSPAQESHETSNDGVIGWLTINKPHPNPEAMVDPALKSDATFGIAVDAITAALPYIDYASYDTNGDQAVDPSELAILIVVAGHEGSTSGTLYGPSVWGHTSGGIIGPFDVYHDGSQLYIAGYAEIGEVHDNDHRATLGIMVHELGHLIFGLPDLYDTDFSSSGIGGFGVMGYGSWGRDVVVDTYRGETPVLPTAWTQLQLQWVQARAAGPLVSAGRESVPSAMPSVGRVTVGSLQESGFWSCSRYESFLLHYRTNVGYDRGLNEFLDPVAGAFDAGMVIYHVDESRNNNTQDSRRLVDVEEANGIPMGLGSGLNTHLWYPGNVTLFNNTSTPASDANNWTESGVEVEALSTSLTSTGDEAINIRIASVCDVLPLTGIPTFSAFP